MFAVVVGEPLNHLLDVVPANVTTGGDHFFVRHGSSLVIKETRYILVIGGERNVNLRFPVFRQME